MESKRTLPGLDTSLSLHNLPWPTPWTALFGRAGDLHVEIGFGRGHFLLDLARRRPTANIVGVEISNRSLSAAERDARRYGLSNVRLVHATGQSALAHLFDEASIAALYVHFPDPWFKTRHAHRRLLAPPTIALIASRLAPGGALYAATDVAAYARDIDRALGAAEGLVNAVPGPDRWRSERPDGVPTKYEALAVAAGRPCAYFHYTRTAAPVPPRPVLSERSMPHVALCSSTSLPAAAAAFAPHEVAAAGCRIHPLDVYVGPHSLLIDTVVIEPTIEQRIAVLVHPRADGAWVVGLSTIGQPRATLGCHLAVAVVARWLLRVVADAEIAGDALSLDPAARALLFRDDPAMDGALDGSLDGSLDEAPGGATGAATADEPPSSDPGAATR
ncbi:MAG: tRNA (guanosine(46)-N7)-methyltransferase TrmB [Ardenticatenales bacterium]